MTVNDLLFSLSRIAQLQHEAVDRLALQEAVASATTSAREPAARRLHASGESAVTVMAMITETLCVPAAHWLARPDPAAMPALLHHPREGWAVIRGQNASGQWVCECWTPDSPAAVERILDDNELRKCPVARLRLSKPYSASDSPVLRLMGEELLKHRRILAETALGGVMIAMTTLLSSFYSAQVYDRVIPASASETLLVLTLGMVALMAFEFVVKTVRSLLYERLTSQVDQQLARAVYARFLSIRLDQMPQSVGSLASQLRGHETVRHFLTGLSTGLLVDFPFALLFALVMAMIAGWLGLIPLVFMVVAIAIGLLTQRRMDALSKAAHAAGNFKTGLLVESIEGAEIIKAGQGGWRLLSRWMNCVDDARHQELGLRQFSEHGQHLTSLFQQASYVALVAAGALMVSRGELSVGELIACSVLSGRVLAPIGTIAHQMIAWSHAKAALKGLDALWALESDHHGQQHPVIPSRLSGHFRIDNVQIDYRQRPALTIPQLEIRPGEKIAVLGPVGAGKTTLLRLLAGLYKPAQGRVLLDDIDLSHIARPALAEQMGYLPQDGRLFAGTLRENLILGMLDPGDEHINALARQTGLYATVIERHPKGLQQEIFEGGQGLSGGQRQLVNLTRVFLRHPALWLLDEPTASMDRALELQVLRALQLTVGPQETLIVVTHKPVILQLVQRVIVVAEGRVVLDGPTAEVLARLNQVPANTGSTG
jgi:ATP-binding cassette subfamily C protein LapB